MDRRVLGIREHLSKKLDPYRYEHTLGVSYTAQALAMRYGYDLDKAELAGLLHDCAKRYDDETLLKKCLKNQIPISEAEGRNPSLLHAKLGAYMAQYKYGVDDPEILDAIRCHTTGRADMTLLDEILYVADYIEPRRYKAAELPEMRKLAFIDLDEACLAIMKSIISYLETQDDPVDSITIDACRSMEEKVSARHRAAKKEDLSLKEETTVEHIQRNGTNRLRSFIREKRRRH